MIYKSYADLADTISSRLHLVPNDVDLIVGIPRSGLLAATVVALQLNRHLCDLSAFCGNVVLGKGRTRRAGSQSLTHPFDARKVLVLDDSIASGQSMMDARRLVETCGFTGEVLYGAVFGTEPQAHPLDIVFERTPLPRLFQWNLFHRREAERYCVDIDGVLCLDPTPEQNDDGAGYDRFLTEALTLARPTYRLGHLVTSRLERFRPQTERWLAQNGIEYGQLHMLDVATAEERRRRRLHASFKASVYGAIPDALIFIESEAHQASEICDRSGRPVLDYGRQQLVQPGTLTLGALQNQSRRLTFRLKRKLNHLLGARR